MSFNIGTNGNLEENINNLVAKINANFFNIIIIFGATRTGKSTLGMQIGNYMSKKLNSPFSVENVFFDVAKLVKEAQKGKERMVYILDEASFDLLGEDWHKQAQKDLIKIFNTAAKYNQTFILLIPYVEDLRKRFIRDDHTRGIWVRSLRRRKKKTGEIVYHRGYMCMLDNYDLLAMYRHLRYWNYHKANQMFKFDDKFTADLSFIDEKQYQKKKDSAIQEFNKEAEKQKGKKTQEDLEEEMFGTDEDYKELIKKTNKKFKPKVEDFDYGGI